jgi:hypothetical protein
MRVFAHQNGRLIGEPTWLSVSGTIHDELPHSLRTGAPRVRHGGHRQEAASIGDTG